MMRIKTLVIDDEYLNRDLIIKLIQKLNNNFDIIGDAENIDDAFDLIQKHNPDLIFLDIKMPGGSGFDLLSRFKDVNFEVVFVTGFDEYAIQAFEFNALDYVLKPIDTIKLKATLDKVFYRISSKLSIVNNFKEILSVYNPDSHFISKIPIHKNDIVELIDVSEIVSIEANEGYTIFKTFSKGNYTSAKQLSSFEFIIEKNKSFVKINKGVFINLNYLESYSKSNFCIIKLKNDDLYEVSRRKKTEILSILDKIK